MGRTTTLALAAVALLATSAPAQRVSLHAENTLNITRPDAIVSMPWPTILAQIPDAEPGHVRVIDPVTQKEVVSQVVDNDGDGKHDELIFHTDFFPGEVKEFIVERAMPTARPTQPRVFVTHSMPRDDIAWESDRIAFRLFGQGLWKTDSLYSNGVDVWMKRVHYPVIEKWYAKGTEALHRDTGEGADFFETQRSLGAGGTALWRNGRLWPAANFHTWRIIANGPLRAVFELKYDPWEAAGLRVSETKRVWIDAGYNVSRVTSTFHIESGSAPEDTVVPFAVGLVKRPGLVGVESKEHRWSWITGWGPVSPRHGGHGDLGTAILLPRVELDDWKDTGDHLVALAHAKSDEPVTYYIGAGWTGSGDFRDVTDWSTYLDEVAQRLATPVRVTFGVVAASPYPNVRTPAAIPLWPLGAPGAVGYDTADIPAITAYLPQPGKATGAAVLVFPGGGYRHEAMDVEGSQPAEWLNDLGIAAFVVRYRLGLRYHHPAMYDDAMRAVRYVRAHAADFHVDPARIGVLGFSAGGHMASTAGVHFDAGNPASPDPVERVSSRPAFMILVYPVITFEEPYAHRGSRYNVLGPKPDTALMRYLSTESHVSKSTPPAFIITTTDDESVPVENSIMFYSALHRAGVPVELHVYEHGKHGFGNGSEDPVLSTWTSLAAAWLDRHTRTQSASSGGTMRARFPIQNP